MTFLFDIGKVLLDFHFESSLERLFPPGTENPAARLDRLLAKKDDFEKGLIPAADYIPWAIEVLESPAGHADFEHAWRDIFTPVDPMWAVVRELAAAGHRLILFSNTNEIHIPWVLDEYEIFQHFEHGVFSFEARSIKPEPEIYHHAIEKHDLVPAETCYIDDLPANIDTGRRLGFRCWQYDMADHQAFENWLHPQLKA